jgi:sec-independent protein translocase protein TatC
MLLERRRTVDHDDEVEWDQKEMTFTEHLRELRNRLMICAVTVTVIGVCMFYPSIYVINWMKHEYFPGITLHAFGPVDAVGTMFRFSLYTAIVLGLPVIMHQTWLFIVPAVHPRTRRVVYKLIAPAFGLAALGILFAHFLVIPVVVRGTTFITSLLATPTYGIGATLNLVLLLFLAFALIFQLPMVLIMLARIGLLSSKSLRAFRRYSIMGSMLIGGIAAPDGQPTTMMLMAAPLYLLYEASIWIIVVLERSWQRESAYAS